MHSTAPLTSLSWISCSSWGKLDSSLEFEDDPFLGFLGLEQPPTSLRIHSWRRGTLECGCWLRSFELILRRNSNRSFANWHMKIQIQFIRLKMERLMITSTLKVKLTCLSLNSRNENSKLSDKYSDWLKFRKDRKMIPG